MKNRKHDSSKVSKVPLYSGLRHPEKREEILWKEFKRACDIWLIKNGLQSIAELNWKNQTTRKKADRLEEK